jgi:hypothetical protein
MTDPSAIAYRCKSQRRSVLRELPRPSSDHLPLLHLEGLVLVQGASPPTAFRPHPRHRSVHWHARRAAYTHQRQRCRRERAQEVNRRHSGRATEEVVRLPEGTRNGFVLECCCWPHRTF